MAVLKVLPKGDSKVQDYAALANRTHRFHGWEEKPMTGEVYQNPVTGKDAKHSTYVKKCAVIELPVTTEYLRAIKGDPRSGAASADLWPADQATAQLAGVPFDPDFGGEYPSLSSTSTPSAPAAKASASAKAGS